MGYNKPINRNLLGDTVMKIHELLDTKRHYDGEDGGFSESFESIRVSVEDEYEVIPVESMESVDAFLEWAKGNG